MLDGTTFNQEQDPLLVKTVVYGNAQDIVKAIEAGGNPKVQDSSGVTLLHIAVGNRRAPSVIQQLIQLGVNIDGAILETGCTALHLAAKQRDVEACKALIEGGADTEKSDLNGENIWDHASDNGPVFLQALVDASKKTLMPIGNEAVRAFLAAVGAARAREPGGAILEAITKEQLHGIYDFVLGDQIDSTMLAALKPGQSKRFAKEDTKLARTVSIDCTHKGQLHLLIEAKTKLAAHTRYSRDKNKGLRKCGSLKTGTPSWRICADSEEPYFTLVAGLSEYRDMLTEIRFAQEFDSRYLTWLEMGALYTSKTGANKICIHAPKGLPLREFISSYQYPTDQKILNKLILDLLSAIELIHQSGKVHQDIKPDNILIKIKKNVQDKLEYSLEITDFEFVRKTGERNPQANSMYESPEILRCYIKRGSRYHDYFYPKVSTAYVSFAREYYEAIGDCAENEQVHPANDMWALGITIFEMLHKHRPNPKNAEDLAKINADPLLSGLLQLQRAVRFDIDEAIASHLQKMLVKQLEEVALPDERVVELVSQMKEVRFSPSSSQKVAPLPATSHRPILPPGIL